MHQKTAWNHTICFMDDPIYRVHYSLGQICRGVGAPFKNAESEHSALRSGSHLDAENNKQREGRAQRAASALKGAVHAGGVLSSTQPGSILIVIILKS